MYRILSLFILSFLLNLTNLKAGDGFKSIIKEKDREKARSLYDARKAKLEKKKETARNKETVALLDEEISTLDTYLNLKFVPGIADEELKKAKVICTNAYFKRRNKFEKLRLQVLKQINWLI